jgi:hypothetical protein
MIQVFKVKVENGRDKSRTVPAFHPDHFRIYGKIREREWDGMYREWERKQEKHHPVRISGVPF